jgi:UDP-N-acetylglucosamine/UDP-N-acetylgalactosamine 4-epimerase
MTEQLNILVTGGAGFIGSNLIANLLSQKHRVVCLDNFATGHTHNISEYINNPNFTLIEGDIRDFSLCAKAVQGIDVIHHHAALGSVPRSIADPITTNQVNVDGFVHMLMAAKEAQVKKFIYASSSSTYGDADYSPKIETKKGNLLSPYAVTKRANDLYADVFSKTYGLQTIGLCYFNVFGPKQDPNGSYAAAIPKFIQLLLQHTPPTIFGDGEQSRDFTYVENVVHANVCAGLYAGNNLHAEYNVACGGSITLNKLTRLIIDALAVYDPAIASITPLHTDVRKGDILHSLASIEKAQKELGYNPKVSIANGIQKTVAWFWENRMGS